MTDDIMNFDIPILEHSIIKVIGVGGGGSNAVNHMYRQGIKDVDFVICNTDAQALEKSPIPTKIQLGKSLTQGLGAGNVPDKGKEAAVESIDDIRNLLGQGTKMAFITVGMGGGTGTGAAPIVAEAAKEMGILTVGIVTIPFKFEGKRRIYQAVEGIKQLRKHVDSLLVINNERLRDIYGNLKLSEAFGYADNILTVAAKGIAEIITVHGHMNVDFADVNTVMSNSGVALMGTGLSEGEGRAVAAIKQALESPLLSNNNIRGAKNILLNITSGNTEITMDEIGEISDYVQDVAGNNADIILGTGSDDNLDQQISVTIIATGFNENSIPELVAKKPDEDASDRKVIELDLDKKPMEQKQTVNAEDAAIKSIYGDNKAKEVKIEFFDNSDDKKPAKEIDLSDSGTIDDMHNIPAYKRFKKE
ncbi:MAG: cell division protein FtsZ [Bacteroidales bacterium]|nr:cell division protein FtsZ [Bacteroidales bacterium]